MFKIFNPLLGVHQEVLNREEALSLWSTIVLEVTNHFQQKPHIPGRYLYEPSWAADFDIAYAFYCSKHNIVVSDILETTGLGPLNHAHSVFNTTTGNHWSNTFSYIGENQKVFHIKVHDSEVTDWYVQQGQIGNQTYEWVAFNLQTGEPIEVYERISPTILQKSNLIDPTIDLVETYFMPLAEMPANIIEAAEGVPYKETITAYSEKSYGLIFEYLPPYLITEEQWPDNIKSEISILKQESVRIARDLALELVTVVSVDIDIQGVETWTPYSFEN